LDLGELQVFLMVAKEGSFSRAGERLYRTQPAISLAIRSWRTPSASLSSSAAPGPSALPMRERF